MWERVRDNENFAVEVKSNRGADRVYLIKANKVSFRAESGERVGPMEASKDDPNSVLTDRDHCARRGIRGYLSFPPSSYTGARGLLVEKRT